MRETPLTTAGVGANLEIAKLLIARGANLQVAMALALDQKLPEAAAFISNVAHNPEARRAPERHVLFRSTNERRCSDHARDSFEQLRSHVGDLLKVSDFYLLDLANSGQTVNLAREAFARIPVIEKKKLKFEVSDATPMAAIFEGALSTGDDLLIGEIHSHSAPKKAMIDHMDLLVKHHAAIALEHVPRFPFQLMWDQYFADPNPDAPMPDRLKFYLKEQDDGHKWRSESPRLLDASGNDLYGYYALAVAAKKKGVPLIFFETTGTKEAGFSREGGSANGFERMGAMNWVEKNIVDAERKGHKVVHFVGSAHLHNRHGALGLSELYGHAPSVVITDGVADHPLPNRLNVNQGDEGIIADIQVTPSKIVEPAKVAESEPAPPAKRAKSAGPAGE
jgi:hypothetical protein